MNRLLAQERNFQAEQTYLLRAATQLLAPIESPAESSRGVGALTEEIMLASCKKAIRFNQPVSDGMRRFIMNLKNLNNIVFKLTLTPCGVAVRYLKWLFESLGTNAPNPVPPNPLRQMLKEMQAEIDERYKLYSAWRVSGAAEREAFILISLYASALLAWLDEFCGSLPFFAIAAGWAHSGRGIAPELSQELDERRRELRVWEAAIDIIQQEHLHATVFPADWRRLLDLGQLQLGALETVPGFSEPADQGSEELCREEARARLNTIMETARVHANITEAHELLFTLTKAHLKLIRTVEDSRQLAAFASSPSQHQVEPGRADPEPKTARAQRAQRKRPSSKPKRAPRRGGRK